MLTSYSFLIHYYVNEKVKTIKLLDNNIITFLLLDIKMCACKTHKSVTIQENDLQVEYRVRIKNDGILCNHEMNKLPLPLGQDQAQCITAQTL